MGGRSMPVYCEHHKMVDSGDFGGTPERCELCEAEALDYATLRGRIAELESKLDALDKLAEHNENRAVAAESRLDTAHSLILRAHEALNYTGVVEGIDKWTEQADEWLGVVEKPALKKLEHGPYDEVYEQGLKWLDENG